MIVENRYSMKLPGSGKSVRAVSYSDGVDAPRDPEEAGVCLEVGPVRKPGSDLVRVGSGRDGSAGLLVSLDGCVGESVPVFVDFGGRRYSLEPDGDSAVLRPVDFMEELGALRVAAGNAGWTADIGPGETAGHRRVVFATKVNGGVVLDVELKVYGEVTPGKAAGALMSYIELFSPLGEARDRMVHLHDALCGRAVR